MTTKNTGTVTVNDGTIPHYETHGYPSPDHPSLLFLHYWGGSPPTWAALLALPAFADYHAICYHARGWAPSTGPPLPSAYGIEVMSKDLSAIISATGLSDSRVGFVLVGHSMGAKVAQYYAGNAASPSLKALVLVAPAPLRGLNLPVEAKEQQGAAYQSIEGVKFVLDHVLTAGRGSLTEDVVGVCVKDSLRGNEWAKKAWPDYALGEGFESLAAKINVPVWS